MRAYLRSKLETQEHWRWVGVLGGMTLLAVSASQACDAGGSSKLDASGSANGGSGTTLSASGGLSGVGGGTGGTGACAEVGAVAMPGVLDADIIFVIDNSGSMTDEAAFVQASMNDFSNILVSSGIDFHVILISADDTDDQGVCVPIQLGSGTCPNDENLPTFRHVVQEVGSNNGLQLILDTYPQWQSSLRAGATKTLAIITDDDSSKTAADFTNELLALDPTFMGFKFHGIVAPYDLSASTCTPCILFPPCSNCDPCCAPDPYLSLACTALPAAEGTVYKQLIMQTQGTIGDLCLQQFVPVFQAIATAVVNAAQVPCVYDIPPPPAGQTFELGMVNVEYKPDANAPPQQILNVPGGAPDCGTTGGWYYDDPVNPTRVILCPTTCAEVQLGSMPSVTVKFGCATQIK